MQRDYKWSIHDGYYYFYEPNRNELEKGFEIIRTQSGPGRWNIDAVCIASCADERMAKQIIDWIILYGISL